MKVKLSLFLVAILLPVFAFSQSVLTIFSEDGDKFTLYLNGSQQNTVSQTNLRIDGLSQAFYKAKIVFDDKTKAPIDKNIAVNDPATNAPADVVYKIKNKDGEMKLRYFSAQPVPPSYTPPTDVYVMHYGQPEPPPTTTVTQTTVTTTNTNPTTGVSMGVNAGGMNMNISIQDPNIRANSVTQTTTTTSYSSTTSSENSSYNNEPRHERHESRGCDYPMDWGSFKSAKETVEKASFEETKLSTAKTIVGSNCLSTDQVMQICKLFGFEESKLAFAKFAYPRTTDQGNYFKVSNVFDFDASKTDLNDFISRGGK
jgi:hypothetical protein